jgi:signal transduction histidine kinase
LGKDETLTIGRGKLRMAGTESGTTETTGGSPGRRLAKVLPARRRLERREVVLGAATLLFLAIVVARELAPGNRDEMVGLMFVIPIALVGLELGLWAGVGAGLGTMLFVAARGSHSEPILDAVGLTMRGMVYVGVGALAGRFSDRMRAFQLRQAQLLAAEQERAALAQELCRLQERLEEQYSHASHILDVHERERRQIAEQLHERAAQAMAAALLAVDRVQGGNTVDELAQAQLQRARQSVRDCIAELRSVAGSLRSPVLEELGLKPALERLCETDRRERSRPVDLSVHDVPPRIASDAELSAYRLVEEALDALADMAEVRVAVHGAECALKIELRARPAAAAAGNRIEHERLKARLLTARARLEIVGGSLLSSRSDEGVIVAVEIPLIPTAGLDDEEAVAL